MSMDPSGSLQLGFGVSPAGKRRTGFGVLLQVAQHSVEQCASLVSVGSDVSSKHVPKHEQPNFLKSLNFTC